MAVRRLSVGGSRRACPLPGEEEQSIASPFFNYLNGH